MSRGSPPRFIAPFYGMRLRLRRAGVRLSGRTAAAKARNGLGGLAGAACTQLELRTAHRSYGYYSYGYATKVFF